MTLENQINIWNTFAEACEGDERNAAPFCKQLAEWLQELKERREKESRETGTVVEWIQYPSEDEQPPQGIEVLVTLSSGDVVVDFYSGSDFLTYGPRVVAWMRFPEPWERWCN